MKQLYVKFALFILPIFLVLLLFPIDKLNVYKGIENDCMGRGKWIYDRLFENEKPIDILFLGSSHTLNSIDDKSITESLAKQRQIEVVNFGYCRSGRNLTYVLLQDVIANKNLNKLIIEVRENEDLYSHPMFPYLGDMGDVLLPVMLYNRDFASDYVDYLTYKIALIQESVLNQDSVQVTDWRPYGFAPVPDTAELILMNEKKANRDPSVFDKSEMERDFYLKFPRTYLEKIASTCEKHGIEMSFLYLPSFGWEMETPLEMNTYLKYGEVLIPPKSIFEDPNNWYDPNHLNGTGAQLVSNWLSTELKKTSDSI